VEFKARGSFEPVTDMVGGGPFGLEPGQWTDDTSMALCLAESLIGKQGFDARDQMERYVRWYQGGHLSSTGHCFDIGNATSAALLRFERTGEPFSGSTDPYSAGNGSIMRLAPIPMFFCLDAEQAVLRASDSSRTTHGTKECVDACSLYALMLVEALKGKQKVVQMNPRRKQQIKFLTKQELQVVLEQAKKQSLREHCMVLLAYRHGLRASEVCGIHIDHVDLTAGNIRCERGKGSVSNWQSLARDELKAIRLWLKHRPKTDDPHLFISRNGGAMSRSQFYRVFKSLCEAIKIPEDKRHPHVLKHSLGTHMANAGMPVQVIQHRLGHRNISSTMVYVQMSNIYVDRAVQAVLDSGGIV